MAAALEMNQVINWFLNKQSMSPKKLQKLLYYAYSWGLVFLNDDKDNLENKLFEANFEAWVHGPVIRSVYARYAPFKFQDIEKRDSAVEPLPEDIEDILLQVINAYGEFNGNQLENLTHSELPWIEARGNCLPMDSCQTVISDKTIFTYYLDQLGI